MRYVPPHPPRGPGPVAVWRGFFGERTRTAVYGWSEQAFRLPAMRRRVLGFNIYIPLRPEEVQRVLLDNVANYEKPAIAKRLLAPMIGRGLLTAEHQAWRDQRKIVASAFAPAAVDALLPTFAQAARDAMASWNTGVEDMATEATATTLRIIADSLFGGDPRLATPQAMAHIAAALEGLGEARIQALLGLPVLPLTAKGRAARRGQTYLRDTLTRVVKDRVRDGRCDDFLGRLIHALHDRFPPGEASALAIDNAATFYLAGHETTANALAWTLFLLAEQPELQSEVADEARAALSAGGDDVGLPDRLPRLRLVLEESLRLYPPVPRLDRQAVAADRLGDYDVAPGDIISIWPWLLHRHKALWDDPDAFDPSRFASDRKEGRHRFQYIPFGAGPRVCVGARFATVEALVVLAHWLASWRFAPVAGRQIRLSGMTTLRPAGGLPLRLERRG